MRKRNVNHIADTIFWYLIYFLPVIVCLITMMNQSDEFWTNFPHNFTTFWEQFFYDFSMRDNVIYQSLADIFGENGLMPLFPEMGDIGEIHILCFFTWFISVYLAHLMVDFVLFIPRLAHKWLKKGYQDE